ncbi:MAG: Crp/Fnr family transcriptional regulator [Arachidicoccus sp.]|nr:Crp/Fnr family transcriptional regulator [Arachidicoccus sp.]
MNYLLTNIQKVVSLTPQEEELLLSSFEERSVKKKDFLLKEGDISKGLIFVTEGLLRNYSLDKNGFEHVLQFVPPGWWTNDIHSYKTGLPARFFVEAMEDTDYLWIRKKNMEELFIKIPKIERFFRILAENSLVAHQARLISFLSMTAKERYMSFCEQYPSLTDCLPQKQVASYIGVTPEFLSKMLSELKTETKR